MRVLSIYLGSFLLLILGNVASAEDVYLTATGDMVNNFDVFQDCDVCPDMVVLPLGTFHMGSTVEEANAARLRFYESINRDPSDYLARLRDAFLDLGIDPNEPEKGLVRYYESGDMVRSQDPQYFANPFLHEVPRHRVTIDLPIAMGRNEVTREEWAACVEEGGCEQGQRDVPPYAFPACEKAADCVPTPDARIRFRRQNEPFATDPRSPMTGVAIEDIKEYTTWLNEKVGSEVYRLPTEAEWEYAARAGTTTRYAQGDTLTLDQANFMVYRVEIVDGTPVGNYDFGSASKLLRVDDLDAANAWGLRHMSGNASEWTSTCGEGPHRQFETSSQYLAADAEREDCQRSMKGGMYRGHVELARPARRALNSAHNWGTWRGFRIVRDLVPVQ